MKVSTEIDNNFGYEKITQLVDNIPLNNNHSLTQLYMHIYIEYSYTVRPAYEVTSIKQSSVLKCHPFLVKSLNISYELNQFLCSKNTGLILYTYVSLIDKNYKYVNH